MAAPSGRGLNPAQPLKSPRHTDGADTQRAKLPMTRWSACSPPRRLSRGKPVYDMGLQVRTARDAVKFRKRQWQNCELALETDTRKLRTAAGLGPDEPVEQRGLLSILQTGIDNELTEHERRVLVAVALNRVPIDVSRIVSTQHAALCTRHCTTPGSS